MVVMGWLAYDDRLIAVVRTRGIEVAGHGIPQKAQRAPKGARM